MKIFIRSIFFIFLLTVSISVHADVERRAAIDIGSGGTKVIIADVDNDSNSIIDVIYEGSFPVPYQASLDKSVDGTFNAEVMALGLQTIKEIKGIADSYQVEKIVAIATSAFRKANNAKEFVAEIKKHTGIAVSIILQRDEGEIAFFSALASNNFDRNNVIVWDIGTGSLQMTTTTPSGGLAVYMGETMGSVSFKSYIIDTIQEKDIENANSPNPISEDELKMADRYARAFGRKAYPIIKEKIQNEATIVGIGRLFYQSIRPVAAEEGVITRKGLRNFIETSLNKTDEELNNPFAYVDVSNCILTLAIMKALHIQEIYSVESTSTRGLLISPTYWQ